MLVVLVVMVVMVVICFGVLTEKHEFATFCSITVSRDMDISEMLPWIND